MTRNNQGEFAKDHTLRSFILSVIAVAILVAGGLWYHFTHPIIETKTVTIDNSDVNFAQKVDSLEKSVAFHPSLVALNSSWTLDLLLKLGTIDFTNSFC